MRRLLIPLSVDTIDAVALGGWVSLWQPLLASRRPLSGRRKLLDVPHDEMRAWVAVGRVVGVVVESGDDVWPPVDVFVCDARGACIAHRRVLPVPDGYDGDFVAEVPPHVTRGPR
jgi:hypothetical protein